MTTIAYKDGIASYYSRPMRDCIVADDFDKKYDLSYVDEIKKNIVRNESIINELDKIIEKINSNIKYTTPEFTKSVDDNFWELI